MRHYLRYFLIMSKDIGKRLAIRLKALRKGLGLTQAELSKKCKISLRHIQAIESGNTDVRITTLETLAKALNVKAYQLICIEETSSIIKKTIQKKDLPICQEEALCPKGSNYLQITPYCPLDELNIAIQICDSNGLIIYTNAKAHEFHGATRDELTRKYYVWDFLTSEKEKEDLKKYLKYLNKEQPKPTPYLNESKSFGGEIFKVQVNWNYILDENGKNLGFFSTLNKA